MLKRFQNTYRKTRRQAKDAIDFWIIRRAVSRAAERSFQADKRYFVDYML